MGLTYDEIGKLSGMERDAVMKQVNSALSGTSGAGSYLSKPENWFGGSQKDALGNITNSMGILPGVFSAFNTYNRWATGKEEAEVAADKLDFNKRMGYTNMAMKLDEYGMAKNRISKNLESAAMGPGRDHAALDQKYNTGAGLVNMDGSMQQLGADIPAQYKPSSYGMRSATDSGPVMAGSQSAVGQLGQPQPVQPIPPIGQRSAVAGVAGRPAPVPGSTKPTIQKPLEPTRVG